MKALFTLKPGKWLCVTREGERTIEWSDGTKTLDLDKYLYVLNIPTQEPEASNASAQSSAASTQTSVEPLPSGAPEPPSEEPA